MCVVLLLISHIEYLWDNLTNNYDLKASAEDVVKVEVMHSRRSLLFQYSAIRGGSFLFYHILLPFGCFMLILALT